MLNLARPGVTLLFAALLAGAPLAFAETAPRHTTAAVSPVGSMPVRGMSMAEVEEHFGKPVRKTAAVGKPPISQWHYDGFVVYFEYTHVIHALATDD